MSRSNVTGHVYLVGAGPGDPRLVSLRAVELLRRADVVLADGLVNPQLRRHLAPAAEWISVGKHGQERIWRQAEINDAMVVHALAGRTVVRLKGGDPAIFARTAEELQCLEAADIPFEVVPGITTASAVTAYAGIPLTHRDWSSAVAFVTGQMQALEGESTVEEPIEWDRLAQFPGTLVIYMGVTTAGSWSRRLIQGGLPPTTPVALIRRCSWPDQRVVHCELARVPQCLDESPKLRPPVVAIVGEVARLGKAFDWFSHRPLFGKTIVVTRPVERSGESIERLSELGANVLLQSGITLEPLDDFQELDAIQSRLDEFDWLIFSSASGVDSFFARLHQSGLDGRSLHRCRVAGVGPSVAEALNNWRIHCDLLPDPARHRWNARSLCERLLEAWSLDCLRPQRCLNVRTPRGRPTIEEELTRAGHHVQSVDVYLSRDVTVVDEEVQAAVEAGGIDYILATSPTIAGNLARLFAEQIARLQWVAISEEVAAVLRTAGALRIHVAQQSSLEAMIECLLADVA